MVFTEVVRWLFYVQEQVMSKNMETDWWLTQPINDQATQARESQDENKGGYSSASSKAPFRDCNPEEDYQDLITSPVLDGKYCEVQGKGGIDED